MSVESAKAVAGGVAGAFSDLITYLLTTYVPFLHGLPPDQMQNLELVVTAGMVAAAVYFTPNRPGGKPKTRSTDAPAAPDSDGERD